MRPIKRLAGEQRRALLLDAQLHAIAVEFDLVDPQRAARRHVHDPRELRLDELRHRCARRGQRLRNFFTMQVWRWPSPSPAPYPSPALSARGRGAGLRLRRGNFFCAIGMPHVARTAGDLFQRASGFHRCEFRGQRLGLAGSRFGIGFLDQQPVVAWVAAAAFVAVAKADQRPAALHPLAVEADFQIAALEVTLGIGGLRRPSPLVPKLYRAAAILALRNGAFEGAVVDRVVLDLHSEPLGRRIERRHLGHGPGFVHTVQFQPQIEMQPRRRVALDHEPPPGARAFRDAPSRLRRDREIPLLVVEREARHEELPTSDPAHQHHDEDHD